MSVLDRLELSLPIVQAPMAGVSTPTLAAAVSNAGGLGSLGLGATDATGARATIKALRERTDRAFNVNLFVHANARSDQVREAAWLQGLAPLFRSFGAEPPATLRTIYKSFIDDDDMFAAVLELAPPVVSFHFGLPGLDRIGALKAVGCTLVSSATCLAEAEAARKAGIDVVVAQGWEAGGHRGAFDPEAVDDCLGTVALTRLLVARSGLPVIAAGGIMDGCGIRAALDLGAVAAQLGTAFVACPESGADQAYRDALAGPGAEHTVMTRSISGRAARCVRNRFTEWGAGSGLESPDYPIAYDAGKALHAAAKEAGESGYGAHWAGQGAPMARPMPAAELMAALASEIRNLASRSALDAPVQAANSRR